MPALRPCFRGANASPMNAPLPKPWTQEQFFSWAERQESRNEFNGFQPVAMIGGSLNHDRITGDLEVALMTRLRGSPCEPLVPTPASKPSTMLSDTQTTSLLAPKQRATHAPSLASSSSSKCLARLPAEKIASLKSVNTRPSRASGDTSSPNTAASPQPSWNDQPRIKIGRRRFSPKTTSSVGPKLASNSTSSEMYEGINFDDQASIPE